MLEDRIALAEYRNKLEQTKGKRRFYVLIGCALILGIGLWHFVLDPVFNPEWKRNVVLAKVSSVDYKIPATGTIRPTNQVKINPKMTGVVSQILVKQGDLVKKGQVLAVLDDSNLLGQVAASRSALALNDANYMKVAHGNRPQEIANAEAQVMKNENIVKYAEQTVARAESQVRSSDVALYRDETNARRLTLLAKEGAISDQERLNVVTTAELSRNQYKQTKQELVQAQAALQQARADLQSAQQQLSLFKAGSRSEDVQVAKSARDQAAGNLNYLQSELNDTKIRAPFDGVVTQRYVDEGAVVYPAGNGSQPTSGAILSLAGVLELVAEVAETDMEHVHLNQTVEIVANAFPEKTFHGHVTLIAPEAVVTNNVTTFDVHAALDDDSQRVLLSGMNVSCNFVGDRQENVLVIPTVAITSQDGKTGVLVPGSGGQPTFKSVRTGPTSGSNTVVLEGLKPDEPVLLGLTKSQLESQGYLEKEGGESKGIWPFK